MIWIFKIELLSGRYAEEHWSVTIEIDSASTLEDLYFEIQRAVGFDNDHPYEFYISSTERSQNRVIFNDDNGMVFNASLTSLYPLERGKKLYYMFDYGDSWLFKVTKSRKKEQKAKKDEHYPKVIDECGSRPEQYPCWDE